MVSIKAENVWLKFNIQFIRQELSLRGYLVQMLDRRRKDAQAGRNEKTHFWALRGITMSVEAGEIVGLLGSNGAGKSTLLMALAGIYAPDRGEVTVRGKVGTLLDLTSGFIPDLTGLENIHYNATFLGLSPQYVAEKIDEIVAMADLGDFIHAPLKTYSSGMKARLGFSVAVHINPDVILLDEVMNAGDQAFRQRSTNLLESYRMKGKTVVIASHDIGAFRQFCTRVVLLDHGEIVADGPVEEVIEIYQKRTREYNASAHS